MMPHDPNPYTPPPSDPGDEAIDWLVHLGSGRATAADRAAYVAWRRQSPAHEAAARRTEALWQDIPAARPRSGQGRGMTRRVVLAGSIAASVTALVAGSGMVGPLAGLVSDHATRVGEQRRVRLPDGTMVSLNTATALSVAYDEGERRVVLHEGEALFEVIRDPDRPFIVQAAAGEAQALGTVFTVRRDGTGLDVTVSEGVVEVRGGGHAVRLNANERVSWHGGAEPGSPEAVDARAATAWQRGKLIFNRRPLGEVAAELQRYRPGRILIADDRLRALEVSGIAELDDADGFLRTIEGTLALKVVRLPLLTVIH